jgi:hypothetical protein
MLTRFQLLIVDAADLVSMNETFIRARAIFDQMMEESLAKHSACKFLFYVCPPVD